MMIQSMTIRLLAMLLAVCAFGTGTSAGWSQDGQGSAREEATTSSQRDTRDAASEEAAEPSRDTASRELPEERQTIDYRSQIAPLLAKYCAGCHNAEDKEGNFSIETYADLRRGGDSGLAIVPGNAESSHLIRLVRGDEEPRMPPEGSDGPSSSEIELLQKWIDAGAMGPADEVTGRLPLMTPRLPRAADAEKNITSLALSPDGTQLAVGRFGEIHLLDHLSKTVRQTLVGLPGKVNSLSFSRDGTQLIVGSGVAGLYGHASIWDLATGRQIAEFIGHRDALYDARLSPDGLVLATCSYDQQVLLWDVAVGEIQKTLTGHNGAVYALAFSPDGSVLASASADETVKLWRVADGERLDTLSQPEGEQFAVAFSPDGQHIVAGGADNRIRVWRFVSRETPRINPLRFARFAHEGPLLKLAFSPDGSTLASAAEDRTLKLWETDQFTELHLYEPQSSPVTGLVLEGDNRTVTVSELEGELSRLSAASVATVDEGPAAVKPLPLAWSESAELEAQDEQEPNDVPEQATPVSVPARVSGVIQPMEVGTVDQDYFRFESAAGQQWVIEIEAARNQSPLDSYIEVLDAEGRPIERVLLQAVRNSYFTFRGKDSDTSDDFRVHNWEEMELNEYLYANGEVVKLWLYPRGPDSGFKVYPGSGKRYGYFDTAAVSHALGAPCFIVVPHPPGTSLIPNGLPLFPIYYENDDDSRRRHGADSRLTFTAPADGNYLVRVTDVRGFGGEEYRYDLVIRPRMPDFQVSLTGADPKVNAGSAKEFTVNVERLDEYEGAIRVDIEGLPPGFHVTTPVVIEAGQNSAIGLVSADLDASAPSEEEAKATRVTATAMIGDQEVTREVNNLGSIQLADKPQLFVRTLPDDSSRVGVATGSSEGNPEELAVTPWELVIEPGTTITAKVRIERNGHEGVVSFGNEDSGRNLPHGVYIDNIGLNGLLLLEGQNERTFFITAAKWVPETTRLFHLTARVDGNQSSQPVLLRVRHPIRQAANN